MFNADATIENADWTKVINDKMDVDVPVRTRKNLPLDGDGDGRIYDGTPRERPAPQTQPRERTAANTSRWDDWREDPDVGEWFEIGDDALENEFTASNGQTYTCVLHSEGREDDEFKEYIEDVTNKRVADFEFGDEDGSIKVTGRGSAMEVMRKATVALMKAIKTGSYAMVNFSSLGSESRTKLYKFFAKRAKDMFEGYVGVHFGGSAMSSEFAIVRSDLAEDEGFNAILDGDTSWSGRTIYKTFEFDDEFFEDLYISLFKDNRAYGGRKAVADIITKAPKTPHDADGDGIIYEGTPKERPATNQESLSPQELEVLAVNKLQIERAKRYHNMARQIFTTFTEQNKGATKAEKRAAKFWIWKYIKPDERAKKKMVGTPWIAGDLDKATHKHLDHVAVEQAWFNTLYPDKNDVTIAQIQYSEKSDYLSGKTNLFQIRERPYEQLLNFVADNAERFERVESRIRQWNNLFKNGVTGWMDASDDVEKSVEKITKYGELISQHRAITKQIAENVSNTKKRRELAKEAGAVWMQIDKLLQDHMGGNDVADDHYVPRSERGDIELTVSAKQVMIGTNIHEDEKKTVKSQAEAKVQMATDFVEQFINRNVIDDVIFNLQVKADARANYYAPNKTIIVDRESPVSVYAHEIGHAIEHSNPAVQIAAILFREQRIDEAETFDTPMNEVRKGRYSDDEVGNNDNFGRLFDDDDPSSEYYMGKSYSTGTTEIISMSLERIAQIGPAEFAKRDPEVFEWLTGVLSGKAFR